MEVREVQGVCAGEAWRLAAGSQGGAVRYLWVLPLLGQGLSRAPQHLPALQSGQSLPDQVTAHKERPGSVWGGTRLR